VIGDALRMVAGGSRDHALLALISGQGRQPIERAALLEGRGELQIFEFDPDIGAGDVGQCAAMIKIRPLDETGKRRSRGLDVTKSDRQFCQGCFRVLTHRKSGLGRCWCWQHQRSASTPAILARPLTEKGWLGTERGWLDTPDTHY